MGFALKNIHIPQYTYEDYCRWEGDWELIDGIPYAMASPFYKHQSILANIIYQLKGALSKCRNCTSALELDWIVADNIVVRPDAMVVCGKIGDKEHLKFPPEIIFEILSPSTMEKDRTVKYEIYQSQKVKYYIMIDSEKKIVYVYEFKNKSYQKIKETNNDVLTFEIKNCSIKLNTNKIW